MRDATEMIVSKQMNSEHLCFLVFIFLLFLEINIKLNYKLFINIEIPDFKQLRDKHNKLTN